MTLPPTAPELVERNIGQRDCPHDFQFMGYTHLPTGQFAEYLCMDCGRRATDKRPPLDSAASPVLSSPHLT